jgi:chromatin assembly factor 1 subunit B
MRVSTPQVAFHQRDGGKNDPVLSVDLHPELDVVATGGGDNEVKLWLLKRAAVDESPFVFLSAIAAHQRSVNAVRFSPDGAKLASCSDEGKVCVMERVQPAEQQHPAAPVPLPAAAAAAEVEVETAAAVPAAAATAAAAQPETDGVVKDGSCTAVALRPALLQWDSVSEEKDVRRRYLTGHSADVSDIAWSRDSGLLASGSVDGMVIVWDVLNMRILQRFNDHGHFVQGVCWDPFQHYFCSESADRSIKLYTRAAAKGKKKASAEEDEPPLYGYSLALELTRRSFLSASAPAAAAAAAAAAATAAAPAAAAAVPGGEPDMKLRKELIFLDDSAATFFRRPAWSPDGSVLIAPTGQIRAGARGTAPTTYVYLRGKFATPLLHLPGPVKPSVAVRFSPALFALRRDAGSLTPWLNVPYRMVFAVATLDGVFIYDTQHRRAIAAAEQLHLAQITDLAWSADGLALLVSSNDGYCSLLSLDEAELGARLAADATPDIVKRPRADPRAVEARASAPAPVPSPATPAPVSTTPVTLVARRRVAITPVPALAELQSSPPQQQQQQQQEQEQQQQLQLQHQEKLYEEDEQQPKKRRVELTLVATTEPASCPPCKRCE